MFSMPNRTSASSAEAVGDGWMAALSNWYFSTKSV